MESVQTKKRTEQNTGKTRTRIILIIFFTKQHCNFFYKAREEQKQGKIKQGKGKGVLLCITEKQIFPELRYPRF